MVGLWKHIVCLAALQIFGPAIAIQSSRLALTTNGRGMSPRDRILPILEILERRASVPADKTPVAHPSVAKPSAQSKANTVWPWDDGYSTTVPVPKYTVDPVWKDWKKWRKTVRTRLGIHWLVGQWLKASPEERLKMPSKFHARMMFMAPNAEREEEVAAIYQKDINDPRPSKWPHWMLFPVTPLQEKWEDLTQWKTTAQKPGGQWDLAGMWIYEFPVKRQAMPADFQAEMRRIEAAGVQSEPKRTLERDYMDFRPNIPANNQGPEWKLWRMINAPERVNKATENAKKPLEPTTKTPETSKKTAESIQKTPESAKEKGLMQKVMGLLSWN